MNLWFKFDGRHRIDFKTRLQAEADPVVELPVEPPPARIVLGPDGDEGIELNDALGDLLEWQCSGLAGCHCRSIEPVGKSDPGFPLLDERNNRRDVGMSGINGLGTGNILSSPAEPALFSIVPRPGQVLLDDIADAMACCLITWIQLNNLLVVAVGIIFAWCCQSISPVGVASEYQQFVDPLLFLSGI